MTDVEKAGLDALGGGVRYAGRGRGVRGRVGVEFKSWSESESASCLESESESWSDFKGEHDEER